MDPIRNLGFLLKDVSRLWVRYFEQRAGLLGITLTQAKVLAYLARNEGITQAKLAGMSDTDPMTLVRVLDRMEKDRWIERRADPADRRAYRLYLRPASDPVMQEIQRIGDAARAEALSGLASDERATLLTLLERIHSNLLTLVPNGCEPARAAAEDNAPPARARPRARAHIRRRKAST